ncbi:MAG: hydrolase [Acidimicrobiales bacterium]|nr:hydrolase [Acidimicrobiales bacterium]
MSAMPTTQYARAGDLHIAYQVFGEGPVDLVIAWGTLSQVEVMWEEQGMARFFARLGRFARVIQFDKRGTGLSDAIAGIPTLEERMDDVRAVMDAAGSERAFLFGESEGAPMSVLFAATYPERTLGLILWGGIVRLLADDDFPAGVSPDALEWFLDTLEQLWGTGKAAAMFAPSLADSADRAMWGRFERLAASPGAVRQLMLANAEIDIRPVLPSVGVPTLVVHATGEQMVPVGHGRYYAEHIAGARLVETPGRDHYVGGEDVDAVADETEEFVTGVRPSPAPNRVLATVLFTDIVDSTGNVVAAGDRRWSETLAGHDALVAREVGRQGGTVVKSLGDGALATFDGPARGIRAAQAVVSGIRNLGLEARAGLHTGEIERASDDVSGVAVHLASRVMATAGPGEVRVSRTVRDLVAGSGIEFSPLGPHALKGMPEEWDLFAVTSA